jgi:predicted MFS family arabinose efflux permease
MTSRHGSEPGPRAATFGVFFVNGAMIGTWVGQIPFVQERLDVSKTALGFALLCMALGAMIAMPLAGQVLDRRSSAPTTRAISLVYLPLLALPLFAPSPVLLGAALILFGAANGAMDVAMNAHGVAVERALGRPIMSSLHAGWSFGGLAGSGGVALAVELGVDPRVEGVVASGVLFLAALAITARLGSASAHSDNGPSGFALPSRGVLLIGALCFLVMVTEGAMGDWSGIYLKTDLGAGASAAATGFAGFSLGMALARLTGDGLARRWGPGGVLTGGMALVTVALGVTLLVGDPIVAVIGFVLVGVGIANAVPLLFSAAGRVPPSGPSLAAVFTLGYTGFIVGPPLIGVLADAISLPAALGTLCAAALAVTLLGGRAAEAKTADGSVEPPGRPVPPAAG